MAEADDAGEELAGIEAALKAQEELRGVLPDDLVETYLAALRDKRQNLQAQIRGAGSAALGEGAVAAGAGGVAIGRDLVINQVQVEFGGSKEATDLGTDASPEVLRNAYLNRVMKKCGHVSLAGVDPAVAGREAETRLSLNAVYTALLTEGHYEPRDRMRATTIGEERRHISALERLNRHRRLVLLGDPGSGKSTFVNFVALSLAGEILGSSEANLERLKSPLPTEDGSDQEKPQQWYHRPVIPVRVVLRDFAARGLPEGDQRGTAIHLWEFIAAELEAGGLGDYARLLLNELLVSGGLLLLDGLDEVPEARERRRQIKDAVGDFVDSFPKCRFLLTSRTYAYQNQAWRLDGFNAAVLAPFSSGQIRRFVRLWYQQVAALGRQSSGDAAGSAALLERAIFGSDRLRFLAERPLLLTLMASLHAWRGGSLPRRRERLYADTVELLLDFWEQQRLTRDADGRPILLQPSLAEWLKVDHERVRKALDALAFDAHATQPDLAVAADLAEGDVVARLMHLGEGERNPATLVEYLRDRAGLLEPRGVGVYSFPHRTFQEYLAACHLTDDDYPVKVAELARQDPERWREVALLAAAKAATGATSSVWQMAGEMCFQAPQDDEADIEDVWGAHLAAQALAESADLTALSPHNRIIVERLRQWLRRSINGEELRGTERVLAGESLAAIGDDRFDAETFHLPAEADLGWIEIPGGKFLMGSAPDDAHFEEEQPRHSVELPTYYMARYPVTVDQFGAFASATGHRADSESLRGPGNRPVKSITWPEALKYCRWLNEQLRSLARERTDKPLWQAIAAGKLVAILPSEAQWEKAARGIEARIYPWEGGFDSERANTSEGGIGEPSAVGCYGKWPSPYGCLDMVGNLWEWTLSLWGEDLMKSGFEYPYSATDGREDVEAPGDVLRVLRGGSFALNHKYARCATRDRDLPKGRSNDVGFRVVLSQAPELPES